MARIESLAIGGYYPTPPAVVPLLAAHIRAPMGGGARIAILDPCAGTGAAVLDLADTLTEERKRASYTIYAIEAERERAQELARSVKQHASYASDALHCDAFQVVWDNDYWNKGSDVLFLNPPYDHDKEFGRLEQKFLHRFTGALRPGGVLVFLVPYHALRASAAFLGANYHSISAYRFPAPDYDAFKQVALFAVRSDVPEEDEAQCNRVEAWASDPTTMPVLDWPEAPPYRLPGDSGLSGFKSFEPLEIDLVATMRAARAGVGLRWLGLDQSIDELIDATFPVAQPPKAGHIAQALAAGIFAGRRVVPNAPNDMELPELLVSGSFERVHVTVDTKTNEDGDITGYVQEERPRLRVSVLDLDTYEYHDLAPGTVPTGANVLSEFTIADLLHHYHESLVETLREQCPALHDPANPDHCITLPPTTRTLYHFQDHAAQTCLKLLRAGENPFLLGEVGSGKSVTTLATAQAYGAKRVLVLCPPHLIDSWADQVRAALPGAVARVVTTISDLTVASIESDQPGGGMVVYILTQTTAKLGHAMQAGLSTDRTCPSCGERYSIDEKKLVSERMWCRTRSYIAGNAFAQLAIDLAYLIRPCTSQGGAHWLAPGRILGKMSKTWGAWAPGRLDALLGRLAGYLPEHIDLWPVFALLAVSHPGNCDALIAQTARTLYTCDTAGSTHRETARKLLLLLREDDHIARIGRELEALKLETRSFYGSPWTSFYQEARGEKRSYGDGPRRADGRLTYEHNQNTYERGDVAAAAKALRILGHRVEWKRGKPCNTPLYQSTPNPRRYPVATWISRYGRHLYDFLVLDEGQEYRTEGSAQERAAHRLCEGKPTMLLSGSVMAGKASSLFMNMWALSPRFRREFSRDDVQGFILRYGYRRQFVAIENKKGEKVTYGTHTDRIDDANLTIRSMGESAGVLPLFVLLHLMPIAVWMHKQDIDKELPSYLETREHISMTAEQEKAYEALEGSVVSRIKQDRFQKDFAGRLFGQLGQVPAYPDLCTRDTGNGYDDGHWEVHYPEHVIGGGLVAKAPLFAADTLLPKEGWLIGKVQTELAEERNVLIFVWHTRSGLAQRLQRILRETGIESSYLDATRVSTAKREQWVNGQIAQGCRVMLVNPMAVQTGLNVLTHFCTAIWYEGIADAIVWRQANGRLHRIGQTKPVRVVVAVYRNTTQGDVVDLNASKVKASMMLDALDTSTALEASGASEEYEVVFDLGRALYERISEGGPRRVALSSAPPTAERQQSMFSTVPAWQAEGRKRPPNVEVIAEQYKMF